ncbi:MAG: hypothetical protein J0H74_18640 [Chitinophagaceae bacterium]|nr:hypothetical protein [Chitinophagaceae bacterium]
MSSRKNIYGLLDPKRLNPNIVAIVVGIVIITIIVVFSNKHIKMSFSNWWQIEAIPTPPTDSSANKKVS